ncbi:MAG: hypothetical protein Q9175_003440 [Cornicularia normoerica]
MSVKIFDNPSPETNIFGREEAKIKRQNGNLGDVDAGKVKNTDGNKVFAPNEHYWKVRLFQIGHVVANSGVVDRSCATSVLCSVPLVCNDIDHPPILKPAIHICNDSDAKIKTSSSPHAPLTRYRARYLRATATI